MAEINKKFEETFKKFESIKQQIEKDSSLIPITFQTTSGERTITKESLDEEFDNLKYAPFTIAVCGEVKAGKSTLLNAILFGNNVLPTFETPLTAKLTFIKRSEKPYDYFKVNYYSKNEWDCIEKSQDLQDNMKLAAERYGIYEVNCIEDVSKSEEINDLQKIEQYVSAIDKNDNSSLAGKYTSYVKNVEIFINNENLPKNLQVVDTPGLNDPKAINSKETTNWINNAHAIIYVTVLKGFSASDLKFFQQFMRNRGPEYRIIVQNKIDDDENYKEALSYMKDLGKLPEYSEMKLFSLAETVCSYSGLQMLISKKEAQGFPLTEDEEYYKSGDYDYNPDDLENEISDKLFKNEGAGRIEAVANSLSQVYDANIDKTLNDIEDCKSQIEDYGKEKEELEENHKKLNENDQVIREKIKRKEKEHGLADYLVDIESKLEIRLNENQEVLLTKFKNEIYDLMDQGNYKTVKDNFPTTWDKLLKGCIADLKITLNLMLKNYVTKLDSIDQEMDGELKRLLNKKHLGSFNGSISNNWKLSFLTSEIEEMLDYGDVLPRNVITNIIHSNDRLRDRIYGAVQKSLVSFFDEKLQGLPHILCEVLESRKNDFEKFIASKIQELEDKMQHIKENLDNRDGEIDKLEKCIGELNDKRNLLEQKKIELNKLKVEVMHD